MDGIKTTKNTDEYRMLDYIFLVLRHKDFVVKVTAGVMFLFAVYSLFLPPVYLAETKILPPSTSGPSMASAFAAQLGVMGVPAGLGGKTTTDLYISLLKTKPVLDYVIDKSNLTTTYKINSRDAARKILSENLSVNDDKKSGIITVGFRSRDPQKAAHIANAFVEGLQHLNNNLAITEAGQRRLFFEGQLKSARGDLIASEDALRAFQQRTGTIKVDDEAKATMEAVAALRAKISAKEVQLKVVGSYATAENPDYQRLREESSALRSELARFESRVRADDGAAPTVGRISSLGTEYLRRMREFKYNESLYEILMKQFGIARMDESRDSAVIQVIEKAEAPEKRIGPARRRIIVDAGVMALIISVLVVLVRGYYCAFTSTPAGKEVVAEALTYLDFRPLMADFKMDLALAKVKKHFKK